MNHIGKYGSMARDYMKKNDLLELENLVMTGEYADYFSALNERAYNRKEKIQERLKAQTPPPKGNSFLDRARYNNWLDATAEELVLHEIVYN